MQQKQKKIQDLKNLLAQAKVRLEAYKQQIEQKAHKSLNQDKKIEELTLRLKKVQKYEQKIKSLQNDSTQIMQQYEARLMRYQSTLQQNQKIIHSFQKQQQILTANNKNLCLNIEKLNEIIGKLIFENSQDVNDSIGELCTVEKLKQGINQIDKTLFLEKGIEQLRKTLLLFINSVLIYLQKKKQAKSFFIKKEISLKKEIDTLQSSNNELNEQIKKLKQDLAKRSIEHKKQLEIQKHEYAKKQNKDQPNLQYIKNLMHKTYTAPADVAKMSLKVLQNILKFTDEQIKDIEKKLK